MLRMFKSLLKDTAIYGMTDFIFKFINFALFPLYAFVLTVPEFGIFALITTLTQLLCTLMNCGQTYALQRFYVDKQLNETERTHVTSTGMICFVVMGLAVTGIALGVSYSMRSALNNTMQLPWQFLCLGILAALPYQVFHYCVTSMRINFLSWKFAALTIIQNALSIGISLLLVFKFHLGLLGFISGITIANFLAALLGFLNIRKHFIGRFDWTLAKQMLKFGFPFIFTDMANWLYASMDRWMLGEMANTTQVGYYSIAFKLATVVIFIINAFGLAWTPHAMKLYNSESNYRSYFSQGMTSWFFFLICISAALSLFGQEILMMTTPEAYWPASHLIPLISMGLAFHGTILLSMTGLLIEKKTHQLTLGTWLCALLNFILNLALIPLYGAQGAAIACFMTYVVQSSYFLYCSQKFHPIPLEHQKLVSCLFIAMGILLISSLLLSQPWSYALIVIKLALLAGILFVGFTAKIVSLPATILTKSRA